MSASRAQDRRSKAKVSHEREARMQMYITDDKFIRFLVHRCVA
jgi:hypothetical protein